MRCRKTKCFLAPTFRQTARAIAPVSSTRKQRSERPRVHTLNNLRGEAAEGTALASADNEDEKGSARAKFDLNVAVLLAGFAFESYNSPQVSEDTLREKDAGGCESIYPSELFAYEMYSGQLFVKLIKAVDCPAMDLWATSDPYAVIRVGEATAQTRTMWGAKEPHWNEPLTVLVKSGQEQYLQVAVWDAGILVKPRRMGVASVRIDVTCSSETEVLELPLEGMGGGGRIFLEVRFKSFAELAEERRRWRVPSILDILSGRALQSSVPEDILASISAASTTISSSDFVRFALSSFQDSFPSSIEQIQRSSEARSSLWKDERTTGQERAGGAKLLADDGGTPGVDGGVGESTAKNIPPAKDGEPGEESVPLVLDFAQRVLQRAGWLSTETKTETEATGAKLVTGRSDDGGGVSKVASDAGLPEETTLEMALRLAMSFDERRKFLGQLLQKSGWSDTSPPPSPPPPPAAATAGDERESGVEGKGEIEEGGKGTPPAAADASILPQLNKVLFEKTEEILGTLAVVGASKFQSKKENSNEGAAPGEGPVDVPEVEEKGKLEGEGKNEEEEVSEEEREAMRATFQQAESAVEAWAMLAQSMGQQTFVKSEFEKICFLENGETDTQAAIWRDVKRKRLVVAFRGTEQTKFKDLQTDMSLDPIGWNPERAVSGSFKEEPMVHSGFLRAYDAIRVRLFSLLRFITQPADTAEDPFFPYSSSSTSSSSSWRVLITGHSLGGALATLFSVDLATSNLARERSLSLSMYNFGSPRVGNRRFADLYNTHVRDSWRVVNRRDIIPTVPKLMGYCHVCCAVYLNPGNDSGPQDGDAVLEEDQSAGDVFGTSTPTDLLSSFMRGERQVVDRLLEMEVAMFSSLQDGSALMMHMEDFYYISLLKKVRSSLGLRNGVAADSPSDTNQ